MNKCFFNEGYDCSMYDCTREEYQGMVESNMRLRLENDDLKERINKAIKFMKEIKQNNIFYIKHGYYLHPNATNEEIDKIIKTLEGENNE